MDQTQTKNQKDSSRFAVVNRLPVPTFRFLRVNEAGIGIPTDARAAENDWASISLPEGVTLTSLSGMDDLAENLSAIETGMGDSVDTAFRRQEIPVSLLSVRADAGASPILLPLTVPCRSSAMTALAIHAQKGSDVRIILDIRSDTEACAAARGFFGLSVRVYAEEGARVHLTQIFRMAQEMTWFGDLGGYCDKEAAFSLTTLSLGGSRRTSQSNAFLGAKVLLAGDEASFTNSTGYYCAGQTQMDMNYIADQRGKHTVSDMTFRGILTDHAMKTWRGTIDFKPGSVGSAGDEQEDTLMLSSHVENDSVPVILCGEEDVDGRHGATIGQLSEDMLFYMRARGYTDAQARRLIIQARLKSVAREIPDERLRWEVEQWIEREIA